MLSDVNYKTYRIKFKKTGVAKYISHLDLNRLFSRAFARAGIAVAHSEGFNPHPKIVFASAISLGTESFCEFVDVKIVGTNCVRPQDIQQSFPSGINILDVYEPSNEFKNIDKTRYNIFITPNGFEIGELGNFFDGDVFVEKKPGVIINLKDYICDISIPDALQPYKFIDCVVKTNQEMFLNPENIIKAIQAKYSIDDYFIQKIEIYGKDNAVFR